MKEVIEKVLAEPIRAHFVVANIGSGFRLYEIFKLVCVLDPMNLNLLHYIYTYLI